MITDSDEREALTLVYEKVYPRLMELIDDCGQDFEIPELCLVG
jgi:hypothetical protein